MRAKIVVRTHKHWHKEGQRHQVILPHTGRFDIEVYPSRHGEPAAFLEVYTSHKDGSLHLCLRTTQTHMVVDGDFHTNWVDIMIEQKELPC